MVFHEDTPADELEFDRTLRPRTFDDFVGQDQVRENLRIAIAAARGRGEPLDHVILVGPPGLGKTSLAHLIAAAMDTSILVSSGPALLAPKDLMGPLTQLERGDVLFIDEIHRMPRAVEEYLYSAMEDHVIDIPIDSGPTGRLVRLTVAPFTLVGATTREGLLAAPFRARFGLVERLEAYAVADLVAILQRAAGLLGVRLTADAAMRIAERARGVPRMALRIQRRIRDLAQVRGCAEITGAIADEGLARLKIDELGLEETDRRILRALVDRAEPVGLKTLAAIVEESEDTIEEVFEPHLIRCGLLERTSRGRVATARARLHLGLPGAGGEAASALPFA